MNYGISIVIELIRFRSHTLMAMISIVLIDVCAIWNQNNKLVKISSTKCQKISLINCIGDHVIQPKS